MTDTLITLTASLPAVVLAVCVCAYEMDATSKRMNKAVDHLLGKDTHHALTGGQEDG